MTLRKGHWCWPSRNSSLHWQVGGFDFLSHVQSLRAGLAQCNGAGSVVRLCGFVAAPPTFQCLTHPRHDVRMQCVMLACFVKNIGQCFAQFVAHGPSALIQRSDDQVGFVIGQLQHLLDGGACGVVDVLCGRPRARWQSLRATP